MPGERPPAGSTGDSDPFAGSSHPMGYWVDLEGLQFDDAVESTGTTWIHAMPHGSYQHPVYGKIDITPERTQRFASNVKTKVRGQDLDIDYDHKERTGEAAGWVKDADARSDGLWLLVEWTKDALGKIKSKAYRYFSPEFADEWAHPQGTKHKDVLFGGALTNRPFLKDILPINMSEVFSAKTGGSRVDPKEIAKLLGLPEDATEQQILEALQTKLSTQEGGGDGTQGGEGTGEGGGSEGTQGGDGGSEGGDGTQTEGTQQQQGLFVGASLSEDAIKKLSESNPIVKALFERVNTLETENRDAKVVRKLSEMETSHKTVIPPAIKEKVRKFAETHPSTDVDTVIEMFDDILKSGVVELGERGGRGGSSEETATKKFSDKVEATMQAKKLSYADAASVVAAEDEALFVAYLNEQAEGVTL